MTTLAQTMISDHDLDALISGARYAVTGNCWRFNSNRYKSEAGREYFVGTYVYVSDDYWTYNPRFAFAASYLTGASSGGQEADLGNDLLIEALSLRIGEHGPAHQLTFDGGHGSATVPDGGFALSAPPFDNIAVPPQTSVFVTVAGHVAAGGWRPGLAQGLRDGFGERVEYGPASLAAKVLDPDGIPAGLPLKDADAFFTGPVAGFALGSDGRPSVLILGTSIEEGTGGVRHKCGPLGERGHADYAMTTRRDGTLRLPHLNWARDDAVASGISLERGFTKRSAILHAFAEVPVSMVVDFLGTNDRGADAAAWQDSIAGAVAAVHAHLPGTRYVKTTMLPRTSSSDGFRTVANQTRRAEWANHPDDVATVVNSWIIAGGSGADRAFDVREFWDGRCSGGEHGLFRGDFKGHFSSSTASPISAGSDTIELGALPELGAVLVVDPEGTCEVRTVYAHVSSSPDAVFRVRTFGIASTVFKSAHPAGTTVVESIIEDGTHPSWGMSRKVGPIEGAAMKSSGVAS